MTLDEIDREYDYDRQDADVKAAYRYQAEFRRLLAVYDLARHRLSIGMDGRLYALYVNGEQVEDRPNLMLVSRAARFPLAVALQQIHGVAELCPHIMRHIAGQLLNKEAS